MRWALLEALGQAGTLTATQASEMLGESPANCAFHLRTLAKYGFVEETGGGRGRERPWRESHDGISLEIGSLASLAAWLKGLGDSLGVAVSRDYVTADEARELYTEIHQAFDRIFRADDRSAKRRDPKLRPADAVPVEFMLLAYPILNLPPLPDHPEQDEGSAFPDESAPPG